MKKFCAIIIAIVLVFSFASVANAQITKDQYYARSTLSGNELEFYEERYRSFMDGHVKRNENFGLSNDMADKIVNYVWNDSPELFNYGSFYSNDKKKLLEEQLQQKSKEILSMLNDDMNDYEKVKIIYKYLGDNIDYDYAAMVDKNNGIDTKETLDCQTIIGGLINGKAICGGIADSLQYILYQLDIPCFVVIGTHDNGNHAWNIIQIDGKWYHADLTADLQNIKNGQKPTYFLVSDEFISNDHSFTSLDGTNYNPVLPECPEMYDHPLYNQAIRKDPEATPYVDAVARKLAEKSAQPEEQPNIQPEPEITAETVAKSENLNYIIWVIPIIAVAVILLIRKKHRTN